MSDASIPSPPKLFIQMSGAPGSGKSTTANLLAQRIDGFAVPHDTIKSTLLEEGIPFDKAAQIAYRMDWALAEEAIKQGRSVIIDSPCNWQEILDRGQELALRYGYAYWYVEIRTDINNLALLDARLRARTPMKAQRTCVDESPSAYHSQEDAQARFKKWVRNPCRPDGNVIVVDTAGNLQERIEYILDQLSTSSVRPALRFSNPRLSVRHVPSSHRNLRASCLQSDVVQELACSPFVVKPSVLYPFSSAVMDVG